MQSIHMRAHVDKQGRLTISMPHEFADRDVELVVVFEALKPDEAAVPASPEWPGGFFEEVAGSIPDFPEIEPEGTFEIREPLE